MKKGCKHLVMLLCVVLSVICFIPAISADNSMTASVDEGFVNVADFGAKGTDARDDYSAFMAALDTGKNIYVPEGTYYLSETLVLSDRICRGVSPDNTALISTTSDKTAPVVLFEGCSSIYDLSLQYKIEDIKLDETQGERIGLQLGSEKKPVAEGSVIRSILIQNIGTGIYSPANSGCNGTLIENIEVKMYSYRGVDMQSENRMMNSYSNVYITSFLQDSESNLIKPNCGFVLEGSEYGATINQLNVEHDNMDCAIIFSNVKNLNVSTIHLEGNHLIKDNMGYIYCNNTSGYIANVTTFFTHVTTMNNSIIRFGNSDSKDVLTIGILHNRGINRANTGTHADWIAELEAQGLIQGLNSGAAAKSFTMFKRDPNATGEYEVKVKSYTYYTYTELDDLERYTDFGSDKNLKITVEEN